VNTTRKKPILFIIPYPIAEAPSQRFRFEQYFSVLHAAGYSYEVQSFLDSQNWQIFFKSGNGLKKLKALLNGFIKRCKIVFRAHRFDSIFIHREASPVGPPVFEWIFSVVLKKKIIYDFDDAIWLTDRPNESLALRLIKSRWKVQAICRWAHKVSCGNNYLGDFAKQVNNRVVYNPTTIETRTLHNRALYPHIEKSETVIGWTGSHSTLKYLQEIETALHDIIDANPNVTLLIIADRPPMLKVPFKFVEWNQLSEVEDLLKIDIGIMPLPDDEWSKGKCGFKALQYLALNIPAVVSPVGVNTNIVEHGSNGFLASSSDEWRFYLQKLITDPKLRKEMGEKGRKKVENDYSVASNSAAFLSLFA
jgi:glycosyltransferase involved in cell wall biosynthesis